MARSVILVSFFSFSAAYRVYTARVAHENEEHETQAHAHASDFVPGQLVPGPRSAAPAAIHWNVSVRFRDSPHMNLHGGGGRGAHAARMAMHPEGYHPLEDPGYHPDLPSDWESLPDVWELDWEDEQFWDMEENQWKTRDAKGKWRDQKGGFTTAPDMGSFPPPPFKASVLDEVWGSSLVGTPSEGRVPVRITSPIKIPPLEDGNINGPSDLALLGPVTKYNLNLAEAIESLKRDIPQALRFERDRQRVAPTNWNIYTDSFESDFKEVDQTSMRLLSTLIPSWKANVKGLRANQRVLKELRTLVSTLRFNRVLQSEDMTVTNGMGVNRVGTWVFEDVIETRWIAKLVMKRLQVPQWLPRLPFEGVLGSSRTQPQRPESIVRIEAQSKFYLNGEGKIYRTAIDELYFTVDQKVIDSAELRRVLAILATLPTPRLPLPPDNWSRSVSRQNPPLK